MAKTIKFNLICNGKPIRTIEDLQNHFSIEDVLEYYNNQLLHRWLKVRGYSTELEKVSAITSEKKIDIIKELIAIFDVTTDMAKIKEGIYILEYLDERKKELDRYCSEDYKTDTIIREYRHSYEKLINEILENPKDAAKIKANIAIMTTNYGWILDLNHRDLFWKLQKKSLLPIMCLLMNEESRKYYLPVELINIDTGFNFFDIETNSDKKLMYEYISSITNSAETLTDLEADLGPELKLFSGITDGYWKDLESKGKKYMIINMEAGDYVRSAGQQGGDLSSDDVKNKFIILDGIDYKSNNASHKLLYMEV